jgi:hypothetical protein
MMWEEVAEDRSGRRRRKKDEEGGDGDLWLKERWKKPGRGPQIGRKGSSSGPGYAVCLY